MSAAMTGSIPAVAASRTAGTAEMIGPMIGSSSRMPAVTDRRIAYRPNTGSTSWLSSDQADEREHADRDPEHELRPDPLAEDPPADAEDGPDIEPPGRRQASVELAGQHAPVLEDVEHPDREQQVAEDRPDEAAGTRQDGEEDREVDRRRASLALGDARDHRIDVFAERVGQLQPGVDLGQPFDLDLELHRQGGEVLDEPDELVHEGGEGEVDDLDDRDDRHDVDEQDRERSAHASPDQPAHRRLEQVDEQQADDEGADGIASHPEQRRRGPPQRR